MCQHLQPFPFIQSALFMWAVTFIKGTVNFMLLVCSVGKDYQLLYFLTIQKLNGYLNVALPFAC